MDVLAGTDFFTVEVLTWRGLVTYYVLFFIHLESRKVSIAGISDRPEACWMRQVACNATLEGIGHLNGCRYVLHDRDAKFGAEFCETLAAGGVKSVTSSTSYLVDQSAKQIVARADSYFSQQGWNGAPNS